MDVHRVFSKHPDVVSAAEAGGLRPIVIAEIALVVIRAIKRLGRWRQSSLRQQSHLSDLRRKGIGVVPVDYIAELFLIQISDRNDSLVLCGIDLDGHTELTKIAGTLNALGAVARLVQRGEENADQQ